MIHGDDDGLPSHADIKVGGTNGERASRRAGANGSRRAEKVRTKTKGTSESRCRGLSKAGKQCAASALPGQTFCSKHRQFEDPAPESFADAADDAGYRLLLKQVEEKLLDLLHRFAPRNMPSSAAFRSALQDLFGQMMPAPRQRVLERLSRVLESEFLDPETWRGMWYVVEQGIQGLVDMRRRRAIGQWEVDEYGLDEELFYAIRPAVQFLFNYWFRAKVTGLENVPSEHRALLVCNHSGVLPLDGAMVTEAIWGNHPNPRHVRWLFLKWFVGFPFISAWLNKLGAVLACPENGERLLREDRLVGVFPEGIKGIGKLYRDRYRLARFGRGGFLKISLKTRSPIIPVSVVGAEETYPALYYADFISRPLGLPYLPITPTFPWLGLLGAIPLPSRWHIHFGTPIRFSEKAPEKANDFLVVSLLTEKVRAAIQGQINDSLRERKSVFF